MKALKIVCECRKPAIGLVRRASEQMNIALERSWFVGDTTSDLTTAERAGLTSILVETGEGGRDGKYHVTPDFIAVDLIEAARIIAERTPT